jgi:hypothetical protein
MRRVESISSEPMVSRHFPAASWAFGGSAIRSLLVMSHRQLHLGSSYVVARFADIGALRCDFHGCAAVDATSIYWTDDLGGTVGKLTPR